MITCHCDTPKEDDGGVESRTVYILTHGLETVTVTSSEF